MTKRMTAEDIEAIRKRADDSGEWVVSGYIRHHEESREFRKHARNDVKALLAEVDRLQAAYKVAYEALEFYGHHSNYNNDAENCECCRTSETSEDQGRKASGAMLEMEYGGDTE